MSKQPPDSFPEASIQEETQPRSISDNGAGFSARSHSHPLLLILRILLSAVIILCLAYASQLERDALRTVRFISAGQEDLVVSVPYGESVSLPASPEREHFRFLCWEYADGQPEERESFPVYRDTVLKAHFIVSFPSEKHIPYLETSEGGILNIGATVSVRDFVQILYRLLDTDMKGTGHFTDVPEDDPCFDAAAVLKDLGVLSGTRLHADAPLTRAEMLRILLLLAPPEENSSEDTTDTDSPVQQEESETVPTSVPENSDEAQPEISAGKETRDIDETESEESTENDTASGKKEEPDTETADSAESLEDADSENRGDSGREESEENESADAAEPSESDAGENEDADVEKAEDAGPEESDGISAKAEDADMKSDSPVSFSDLNNDDIRFPLFEAAASAGWIPYGEKIASDADKPLCFGDLALVINHALHRDCPRLALPEKIGTLLDVPVTSEYYDAAVEAAIPHEFRIIKDHEIWISSDPLPMREPGFFFSGVRLHYIDENGSPAADTDVGGLHFNRNGEITTGVPELDAKLWSILEELINPDKMSREEMLRVVYDYVVNSFGYRTWAVYERGAEGWAEKEALRMLREKRGNCYCFAALFYELARFVGYDAKIYSGIVYGEQRVWRTEEGTPVYSPEAYTPHGWVEIEFDGEDYIFDTEYDYRNVQDGFPMRMFMADDKTRGQFGYNKDPAPAPAK